MLTLGCIDLIANVHGSYYILLSYRSLSKDFYSVFCHLVADVRSEICRALKDIILRNCHLCVRGGSFLCMWQAEPYLSESSLHPYGSANCLQGADYSHCPHLSLSRGR